MSDKFKNWLKQNGAEILPCTNEYEEVRFKGSEVGVMYKSGKFSNKYAEKAYNCFILKNKWDGRPLNIGRSNSYKKQKRELLIRDGKCCFYCGKPLLDDITLEHLIPLTAGGLNLLSNMVLAHEYCNSIMGFEALSDKVNYALKMRMEKLITNMNKINI